jgi:hypothetical protein
MRWLVLTLCLVSAACSSESVTPEVEAPPDLTAAAAGLKQVCAGRQACGTIGDFSTNRSAPTFNRAKDYLFKKCRFGGA